MEILPSDLQELHELIRNLNSKIESLVLENQVLKVRVLELEGQKKVNSSNSSKPPSTDGFNFVPNSNKPKSNRKVGGQPGHKGHHLPLQDNPDKIITYRQLKCIHCSENLSEIPPVRAIRRQVMDIPPPQPLIVTEHQAQVIICPCCKKKNVGDFPAHLRAKTQYGPQLLGVLMLMVHQQAIPYDRVARLMGDIYNVKMSPGTVVTATKKLAFNCDPYVVKIAEQLIDEPVVHADETGLSVEKKNQWVHVSCSDQLVHYFLSPKRGAIAIDTHLKGFKGTAVHDGWKSYQKYDCRHALCNAHHLRELTFIHEVQKQNWALDFKNLLTESYVLTKKGVISKSEQDIIQQKAQNILNAGRNEQPPPLPTPEGAKKSRKKSKALNLINRLERYCDQVWLFIKDPSVPFDNNLAERNVRMLKVMQKVKGCFRTSEGATQHLTIRSFFMTAQNAGQNILEQFVKLLSPMIA